MFVVEVREKFSFEENSERAGNPNLAILQSGRAKWLHYDARVGDTTEFATTSRWEPLGLHCTTLRRTQAAHGTVELGFEVKGRVALFTPAQPDDSIAIQSQLWTVRPKDDGGFSGIGLALLVVEALDHGEAATAIDDSEPVRRRIQP